MGALRKEFNGKCVQENFTKYMIHHRSLKLTMNLGCGNVQGDILYERTNNSLTYEFGLHES